MHTVRANDFTLPHRYISLYPRVGGVGFTPLFGLGGYVPLNRVWFSGS